MKAEHEYPSVICDTAQSMLVGIDSLKGNALALPLRAIITGSVYLASKLCTVPRMKIADKSYYLPQRAVTSRDSYA